MGATNFPSIRQYKIKESLGNGKFGDVYKVLNTIYKNILYEINFDEKRYYF